MLLDQAEYVICGAFGGMCTVLVGHPLDTVKVRLQTMPKPGPGELPLYTGTLDCIRKTIAKEGFTGLYKGMGAPLVSVPPIFALSFMGYGLGKLLFTSPMEKSTIIQEFCSGGVAGFFSTMFMAPGERIKCLLQVQQGSGKKLYNGSLDCAIKLYKEGGIRNIYKGTMATLMRDIPASGLYYLTYNHFKRLCTDNGKNEMSILLTVIGGGLAGMSNWIIGMPADVIKSRLQTSETSTTVLNVLKNVIHQDGPLGLYKGIVPVLIRAFPANAACFVGFEICRKLLRIISVLRKKVGAVDKALDHFDDFYKDVFGSNWKSIRSGLLGKQKYVAVLNNYSDVEDTVAYLEKLGALNMRTLFELEKSYIKELLGKERRVQYLHRIWKNEKDEPEINLSQKLDNRNRAVMNLSLEDSLTSADIDVSRLIDDSANAPILSQFVPATKIKGKEDWVLESDHFKYLDKNLNHIVEVQKEYEISFPQYLNIYCFEQGNYSNFAPPRTGTTGIYNYYLMDGGSVLPILALDIKPGDTILDMCGAPGGKTFLALQTLYPNYLVCNDVTASRVDRIMTVLNQYFYDVNEKWIKENRIKVTQTDGRAIGKENYNRVLVDAPCTNDRISVTENDNNIFRPSRIKERLKLPELQSDLLFNALKLVTKGGIVVYSTCSLSPIQNDGVVSMALKKIWEETNLEFVVKDLSPALVQTQSVYRLANHTLTKYGHVVIPFIEQNYGPTFFCKLQRVK